MKRQILLSTLGAGVAILTLTSYGSGPFAGGVGNRTGSTGSLADCSTGGCHAANSNATTVTISLKTLTDGAVTAYTPGETYKVTLDGTNTNSLARFGFQATCVKAASPAVQAGTLIATAASTAVRTAASPNLIEHSFPLAGSSAGVYTVSFNWTAPAPGTGAVRFFATLNAVNYNGTTTGDMPNTATPLTVNEASTAGLGSVRRAPMTLYPNPTAGELRLKLADAGKPAEVTIRDLGGRLVLSQTVSVAGHEAVLDLSALSAGSYVVVAAQGGQRFAASLVKN